MHVLGIVGAFVATFLGQGLGQYRPREGAGLIGAMLSLLLVLTFLLPAARTLSARETCLWLVDAREGP
jgi:uncharacterized membrane protein YeaQ/YmgE (transglycosylase-associated protein family)